MIAIKELLQNEEKDNQSERMFPRYRAGRALRNYDMVVWDIFSMVRMGPSHIFMGFFVVAEVASQFRLRYALDNCRSRRARYLYPQHRRHGRVRIHQREQARACQSSADNGHATDAD
jgi:hypothetical protein